MNNIIAVNTLASWSSFPSAASGLFLDISVPETLGEVKTKGNFPFHSKNQFSSYCTVNAPALMIKFAGKTMLAIIRPGPILHTNYAISVPFPPFFFTKGSAKRGIGLGRGFDNPLSLLRVGNQVCGRLVIPHSSSHEDQGARDCCTSLLRAYSGPLYAVLSLSRN